MSQVSDQYAMAVIQGCLASTPNAAATLGQQPGALKAFVQNVTTITTALLAQRDAVNQSSQQTGSGT